MDLFNCKFLLILFLSTISTADELAYAHADSTLTLNMQTDANNLYAELANYYKKELLECKMFREQILTATEIPDFSGADSYKWEDMRTNYVLPEDSVLGGQNVKLEPLFVVRGKNENYNYFGKLPIPYENRDAYLTNSDVEFPTPHFQILTAKGYAWCKSNAVPRNAITINPICRAIHDGFLTPGTIVENSCRVGWGWKVHFYSNYDVLAIGSKCLK